MSGTTFDDDAGSGDVKGAQSPACVYQPADFETVDEVADRLTLDLQEVDGTFTLSIHYGNRQAVITATR